MPESQEGNHRFLVARCQAAVLLEAAEKTLNLVAFTVGFFIERGGFYPVGMAGDDGLDAPLGTVGPVFVAIVSRVSQDLTRLQALEQGLGLRAVPGLSAGGNQAHGVTQGLGQA